MERDKTESISQPVNKKPLIHIKSKTGWQIINFRELHEYKDLFYLLVGRNIKVKYKQTVLGGLWAVIQPFLSMVVFTLFFGKLAKIPSDGVPYPIFNFTAMVVWTYFANAVTASSSSLVGNAGLVSKVYFPRMIIPASLIVSGLLDFFIAFMVLLAMMFTFGMYPSPAIILVFFLIFLVVLTSGGVGMILAALNARYRDIGYATPFLVQLWMFASPIVYPSSMIPEPYRMIYALNPMTGIIEGFRSVLLGTIPLPWQMLMVSTLVSLALFAMGAFYFRQMERFFADII